MPLRKADPPKEAPDREDELDLRKIRLISEDIDVTLDELPESPLLRAVRPEDRADLQGLKGIRELRLIFRVESRERQGEVIAEAGVGKGGGLP